MTIFNLEQADTCYFSDTFEDSFGVGSIYDADIYFANRMNSDEWSNASDKLKNAAMFEANDIISLLSFDEQRHPNIRSNLNSYENIRKGTYEIAIAFVKGKTIEKEMAAQNVKSSRFANTQVDYVDRIVGLNTRLGIISAKAWFYLQPYLEDYQSVTLCGA